MGIYDRDYYRQPRRSGFSSHLPRTVVGTLIAINVAVWIVDQFTVTADGRYWLSNLFAASPADAHPPVDVVAVSHGRLHPRACWCRAWHLAHRRQHARAVHPGASVEDRYGPREFLRIYLVTLVVANVAWCLITD